MIRRRFLLAIGSCVPALAERTLLERWREIAGATDGTVGANDAARDRVIARLAKAAFDSFNG